MPSRMSASDATSVEVAHRRSTRLRISPPAPSTSTRPGCIHAELEPLARSASPPAGRRRRGRRRTATTDWSMTLLSYVGRSSTPAVIDSAVPATPTTVAADGHRHRAGVEVGVDVGHAGGDRVGARAGRRSGTARASAPSPCPSTARRSGPDASPRISSVDPPPMSITSTGSGRWGAQVADGAVVGERGLLRAPTAPRARRRAGRAPRRAKTSALEESRVADVAQKRIRDTSWCGQDRGVLVDRRERPHQRLVGQPAGRVDALAQPDDPALAHRRRPAGRRPAA